MAQEEGEREKVASQMGELALLLKQEKQLRVIAEQFVQDSEVNNNRFQQVTPLFAGLFLVHVYRYCKQCYPKLR